jgi:hypothetical protein
MKEIWRLLLPGMNVPACGLADEAIVVGDGDTVAERAESGAPPVLAVQLKGFSIFLRTLSKIRR